ncbi:Structural maintenance of chromosomes protein 6 [Coemansia erecta]|uniref:Structural maintenance of chromosomes protein 6 n=1 Tax=Coemansia erecta TaxID=147472 RepID=A0A9W7Y4C5_9FUNG|nr:Structural maintenance of chromosomes protein 6 [Coemansia erecta]
MAKARLKRAPAADDIDLSPVKTKRTRVEQTQEDGIGSDAAGYEEYQSSQDTRPATSVTRISGKRTQASISSEAECGVIENLELIDFMCHMRTVVDLSPRVNFIIGQNGSGKSAILTAMIIVLGGRVAVTNRASALKDFIRGGCSSAVVRARLRNGGLGGYKPEIYGKKIIIERQLNATGATSSFKIINGDTMAVVSRKKEEVVNITDHMGIQVENPINILSQDAAREFLSKTNPDSMYTFFLKGTQLFQLGEDLECVRKAIERAVNSIERKTEVLPEMRAEKRRWEQHYQDMQKARDISANMTSLGKQMAWALVEDAEAEVQKADERIEIQNKKIGKVDEMIEQNSAKIADIEEAVRGIQEQASSQLALVAPLQEERQVPAADMERIKSELRAFKQTEGEMNAEARTTRERITSLNREIETERGRLQNTDQASKERLRARIAELEDSIKDEEAGIARLQEEQLQYEQESKTISDSKGDVTRAFDRSKISVSRSRASLDDLNRQTANRLNAFGRGVPEAVDRIKRAQWRGMQPIGPIGDCIKVRDPKWAPVIETTLDKSMNAFLVDNYADRESLDGILRQVGCNSRIIICNTELFDYAAGEPSSDFLTILRALEISNEVVKRQLINLNRIEQIILVEQRALGDKIMSSNNGGFPSNVIACLTVDGYSVGSRSGGLSTQAMNMVRQSSRLGGDIATAIRREEQQLAEHMREYEDAKQAMDRTTYELDSLRKKHEKATTSIRKSKEAINKAKSEIEKNRDTLRTNEPTKIAELESELERYESQMTSLQTQFRDHHQLQSAKTAELQQCEADIAVIDRKIDAVHSRAEELRREAENKAGESQRHSETIEFYQNKRTLMQETIAEQQAGRRELEEKVASVMADARKLSEERVPVEHSATRLDRMITECRARLDEIERTSSMSLAEVSEKAQSYISAYNKAKEELKNTRLLTDALKSAYHSRIQMWTQFRDSMAMRTRMQFTSLLQQRGYTGNLDFDHQNQTLVPIVKTDQDIVNETASRGANAAGRRGQTGASSAPSFQRKDTKSLSGGEKSFTTICLLLALWEAMNCPVRALDEFDVFMDAANRAIAMKMMVDSAQSKSETQFILITPQDLSVKPNEYISILRLAPPRS